MSRTRLQIALDQLDIARRYTKALLEGLTPDEWFWHPSGLTTHIAWQVAHISIAQYALCLMRVRGKAEADESLIPGSYMKRFGRGSVPAAGAENNPPLEEIQRAFDAVHRQSLAELAEQCDKELDIPVEPPHPMFKTKLEAVSFAPMHELVHAGQIGMLRRQMGKPPLR
jgi:hypothetical protein